MDEVSRLTADDQQVVAQARQISLLPGSDAVRERTGHRDNEAAFASAFGEAQEVIAGLLAVIAGLDEAG